MAMERVDDTHSETPTSVSPPIDRRWERVELGAALVDLDVKFSGESQQKNDDVDYLVDGLISTSSRRLSSKRLVEVCASPHSRFMLRLSGGLTRLLEALSIAEDVATSDEGMRLSLAAVAYMLLQDRANVGLAGCGALRGLAALVRLVAEPRALGTPAATVAAAAPAGGWRKRIALGGKTEASNDKRLELEAESLAHVRRQLEHVRVEPYDPASVNSGELALLALCQLSAQLHRGAGTGGVGVAGDATIGRYGERALDGTRGRPLDEAAWASVVPTLGVAATTLAARAINDARETRSSGWALVHTLQVIEAVATVSPRLQHELAETPSLVARLTELASSLAKGEAGGEGGSGERGGSCGTEMLGAVVRVLINFTHHYPPAVEALMTSGGLPAALALFVVNEQRDRRRSSHTGVGMVGASTTGEGGGEAMGTASLEPDGADWLLADGAPLAQEPEGGGSFDLALLALNLLTNCIEVSEGARGAVSTYRVEASSEGVVGSSLCTASGSSGAFGAEPRGPGACEHLIAVLLARSAPFESELARDLGTGSAIVAVSAVSAAPGASSSSAVVGPRSSALGEDDMRSARPEDWEDLIMAGYCSLLLGVLMRGLPRTRALIASSLPAGLATLVRLLKAFVALQSTAGVLTADGAAPVCALIEEIDAELRKCSDSSDPEELHVDPAASLASAAFAAPTASPEFSPQPQVVRPARPLQTYGAKRPRGQVDVEGEGDPIGRPDHEVDERPLSYRGSSATGENLIAGSSLPVSSISAVPRARKPIVLIRSGSRAVSSSSTSSHGQESAERPGTVIPTEAPVSESASASAGSRLTDDQGCTKVGPASTDISAKYEVDCSEEGERDEAVGEEGGEGHGWHVGDVVVVTPRTQPGMNRPGGHGRITKTNSDGTVDVRYVLGGCDKFVPVALINRPAEVDKDEDDDLLFGGGDLTLLGIGRRRPKRSPPRLD